MPAAKVSFSLPGARDQLAIAGYLDPVLNAETLAFAEAASGSPEEWPEWSHVGAQADALRSTPARSTK